MKEIAHHDNHHSFCRRCPRSTPPTSHQTRIGTSISTVTSPKRLARIAGVLYLLVGITGGFAEGFVEPKVYVAGDAAAMAAAVVANAGVVRLGVVSDLLDQTLFVFLALTLYVLLQHAPKKSPWPDSSRVTSLPGG